MKKTLVAGIGNIFQGDDAFGVEVAQRLLRRQLPDGVKVVDYGIRGFDLAFALMDPWDCVILVDAIAQGGEPGTLYTIEPDLESVPPVTDDALDTHGMHPVNVLRMVKCMGGTPPPLKLVACEPQDLGGEEGRMGLTSPVEAAVDLAIEMVEQLLVAPAIEESSKAKVPMEVRPI